MGQSQGLDNGNDSAIGLCISRSAIERALADRRDFLRRQPALYQHLDVHGHSDAPPSQEPNTHARLQCDRKYPASGHIDSGIRTVSALRVTEQSGCQPIDRQRIANTQARPSDNEYASDNREKLFILSEKVSL